MRTSIIAGLAFSAALTAFAGLSHAAGTGVQPAEGQAVERGLPKDSKSAKRVHYAHKQYGQSVIEPPRAELFRIPAHPVARDCVHVFFPQCGGRSGLNDGTFGLPY
jgi:hypothetical protein